MLNYLPDTMTPCYTSVQATLMYAGLELCRNLSFKLQNFNVRRYLCFPKPAKMRTIFLDFVKKTRPISVFQRIEPHPHFACANVTNVSLQGIEPDI